ncbi:MAG: hypothetical protein PHO32_05095 [Candidatus Cloacimonetes bacterium]|nr:hypothetical protein [Candidatus Cloacimonadota bacterium]
MKHRKKTASWASRMETAAKPFLATNKEQAFRTITNVLIKQNKLFNGEHPLSPQDEGTVRRQFNQFKTECKQMMQSGVSVFECAKRCYELCAAYLTEFTKNRGYEAYASYLEGLGLKKLLMEFENYDGVVRLEHLINHPGQGFSAGELFRATETQEPIIAYRNDNTDPTPTVKLSEWQKKMMWSLYNPIDHANMHEDITLNDGISVGTSSLAIEKYDGKYVEQMLKEKLRFLNKKQKGLLSEEEAKHLEFLDKVLGDALGCKKNIKATPKRGRIFKKPEDNKSYACVKMSINRAIAIFPNGSPERELINKYFRFVNGKFYWGSAERRDETA